MDENSNSTGVPTVSIGGTEILKVVYRGQQVVSFEMIEKVHKRPEGTAKRSFDESREHFIKGEDFFELGRDEIRTNLPEGVFSKFAPKGILVTQRGYFKITRSFKDDLAWAIFDEMLDVYFSARDGSLISSNAPLPKKLKAVGDVMQGFSRLAGLLGLKGNQRALSAAMATHRETGINVLELTGVTHLKAELSEQFVNSTSLGERTDPVKTANEINLLLETMGLQAAHRVPGKRPGKQKIAYWELTAKGKEAGGDYFDTGKKDFRGRAVKQIMWPTSVIALVQSELSK